MNVTSVEDYLGTMSVYVEWHDEKTGKRAADCYALTSVKKVPPKGSAPIAYGSKGIV